MKRTNKNSRGFSVIMILVAVAVVALLGVLGYVAYTAMNTKTSSPSSQSASQTGGQSSEAPEQKGTITGKTSYPSEQLPADEEVCAEKTDGGGEPICVNVGKDQSKTFSLSVSAGKYYVYATAEQEMSGYRAYYTEFVECMDIKDATCGSDTHKNKIPVSVSPGETVSLAEPGDWYAIE